MNFEDMYNEGYCHRLYRQQIAFSNYIAEQGFSHFVTLNFNPNEPIEIDSAHIKIAKFGMKVDRKLYGRHFNKKPTPERTSFIAFPEHKSSNLHFHAAVNSPDIFGFCRQATKIWKELVPSGSINIQLGQFYKYDVEAIAYYVAKKFISEGKSEDFFVYANKFRPS